MKLEVSKGIMEAFVKNTEEPTNDPVTLNAMMYIGKVCDTVV